jgi:hypothetical protein
MSRRPDLSRWAALGGVLMVTALATMALWARPPAASADSVAAPFPARGAVLPTPCAVPVISAACDAVGTIAGGVASVPEALAGNVVEDVAHWVASGAADLLAEAGRAIFDSTSVSLAGRDNQGRPWFVDRYRVMAELAALVMAPMLLLSVLHAVFTGSLGLLGRALANLPIAALGTVGALTVVELLLGITDWASLRVAATIPGDARELLAGIGRVLVTPAVTVPGGGIAVTTFGVVLVAVFMAVISLVVWLELVVRQTAIYLTVLFLPLGFATHVWPALSPWLRRLIETIVALVLSKLVIVAALSLAAGALGAPAGFGTLVAGAGMLLLAAFAPFALFKLIPIATLAGISSLEGLSRRAPRAAVPRLSTAYHVRYLASATSLPAAARTGGGGGSGTGFSPPPLPPGGSGGPGGRPPLPGGSGGGGTLSGPAGGLKSAVGSSGASGPAVAAGAVAHRASGSGSSQARSMLDAATPSPEGGEQR